MTINSDSSMLMVFRGFRVLIVQSEQIETEIVLHVPPYGMNVIGVILRVVVFGEEEWSVKTVVVWLAALLRACPRKMDVVQVGISQFPNFYVGYLLRQSFHILVN